MEPLLERAARARAGGSQSFCLPAGGTRAPELSVRCGAGSADGGCGGAGVDAAEPPAGGAVSLASVAAAAAGQTGQPGVGAGCGATADRADQDGQGAAVGAQRAVGGAVLYSSTLAAADADLDVRRVGDQAVRTQRSSPGVADGRLAPGSAAYAFLDAGLGDAVAADPLPVQRLVDADHPVAARAGGPDDPGDACLVQQVDEPQDGAMRRQIALSGQQAGVFLQGPDQPLPVGGTLGCCPAEGFGDHIAVGARGDQGDQPVDDRGGVTVVGVGTHLAARQALAVPEADASDVAAGGALGGLLSADRAVPVLALALEGSQRLAALGAGRRRDRRGAGLAELDEQVTDGPGCRGPAVGQDCGPHRQGVRQAP